MPCRIASTCETLSTGGDTADLVLFVSNLVDMITGGLSAPVSDTTARELQSYREQSKNKA